MEMFWVKTFSFKVRKVSLILWYCVRMHSMRCVLEASYRGVETKGCQLSQSQSCTRPGGNPANTLLFHTHQLEQRGTGGIDWLIVVGVRHSDFTPGCWLTGPSALCTAGPVFMSVDVFVELCGHIFLYFYTHMRTFDLFLQLKTTSS